MDLFAYVDPTEILQQELGAKTMQTKMAFPHIFSSFYRALAILLSVTLVLTAEPLAFAYSPQETTAPASAKLPVDQLDSLVAPIALYPDPLLSQTLVASTYPLEIVQLQQWLAKNKNLKDKALTDAVMKQPWDPSVQSMAPFPDLVNQLVENIQWTTDLGNAFLAQQSDVMDAVQRMRKKASDKGTLKSSEQQKVETKVVESKQVIVIEQAQPDVVYVPSYNPTVVYGAPAYAYPPIAYPPVGYYAAGMALSFGVGVAMGAAWGGGWGYNSGWGGNNNININNNNNFVNNSNRQNFQGGNRAQAKGGNSTWQHNPQHRGGAPYSDRSTASKYGGSARGDSMSSRQNTARQNQARGNQGAGNRGESFGSGNRASSSGNRGAGVSNNMAGGGRGGDRAGNQSVSRGSSGGSFGGGNASSARASSSRGSSSMGRSGGGGGRSGGGGRRR